MANMKFLIDLDITGNIEASGSATISTVANAASNPNKSLSVNSAGLVQYRTNAQLLSDIGAAYFLSDPAVTTGNIPLRNGATNKMVVSILNQVTSSIQNAKRITVAGRMTITGNGGDANGSTVNLSSSSARLGISLPSSVNGGEPEASLDVGKNARVRGSLNVGATNEQYLFVSTTGDAPVGYVKMGRYGTGTDYGPNTSTAVPQYTSAFGSGGRVVEDIRYYTFKLTRAQMAGLNATPKTLIPAASGYNFFIEDAYFLQNNGGGWAPVFNSGTITLDYLSPSGAKITAASIDATVANTSRDKRKVLGLERKPYVYGNSYGLDNMAIQLNAPSASNSGSGSVAYFLRLKVKKVNIEMDITANNQLIVVS